MFVDGDPARVDATRALLPDAVYTSWRTIRRAVREAMARPPSNPVAPSRLAGYAGTPMARKLGIKPGARVRLIHAREGFERTLGVIPDGATLHRRAVAGVSLTVWVPRDRRELERQVELIGRESGSGGLWIIWPKKASGVATDLTQNVVRRAGLANGLVDYKVAAIDETYSGLKFRTRSSGSNR